MPSLIPYEIINYLENNLTQGSVSCVTGAGISAESGIPTFRGKGGLWEKYDPETYAYPQGLLNLLRKRPDKLANFIIDFYSMLQEAKPNPAHIALAHLEKKGILDATITQNIDNLHKLAGSNNVIELHGNAFRIICPGCGNKIMFSKERINEFVSLLKDKHGSRIGITKILSRFFPRCNCSLRYRVDIVLFGEMLPENELSLAYKALKKCKILLVIGSSLAVYPASMLPLFAKENGARVIEINSQMNDFSQNCDHRIIGSASKILTEIVSLIR